MSITASISALGTLLSNALALTHEILRRKQPEMAKEFLKHTLKKVDIMSRISEIHALPPQERNCAELEALYRQDKENDQKIAIYQAAANNEAARMLSGS